jgi:hypothetical protein
MAWSGRTAIVKRRQHFIARACLPLAARGDVDAVHQDTFLECAAPIS